MIAMLQDRGTRQQTEKYEATGGMCVADSAFSNYSCMIISQKKMKVPDGPLSRAWERYTHVKKAATSM